jgi:hypothetical protein
MSQDQLSDIFHRLSEHDKISLLARWLVELGTCARDTYVPGSDAVVDAPRLRIFNELQHRIAAQLDHLINGEDNRYPDDVFLQMVLAGADEVQCRRRLEGAIEHLVPVA